MKIIEINKIKHSLECYTFDFYYMTGLISFYKNYFDIILYTTCLKCYHYLYDLRSTQHIQEYYISITTKLFI